MLAHIPFRSYFLFQARGSSSPYFSFLSLLEIVLIFFVFMFLIYLIGKIRRQSLDVVRWFQPFAHLHLSSQQFYEALETSINGMEMPGVSTQRITYYETGLFSSSREYLRVSFRSHVFDICAAPFGHGFFLSYWQVDMSDFIRKLIRAIPKIGLVLEAAFYRKTFYQVDTEDTFKSFIHMMLVDAVKTLSSDTVLRGFKELEYNPIEAKHPN